MQQALFKRCTLILTLALVTTAARAQAKYAATRAGDLQIGAGYTSANANYEYVHNRIAGFYFYTDFDFKAHYGIEGSFHQLNDPNSAVYQRTFALGPRYVRHYALGQRDLSPYVTVQGGAGVLNFPKYANLGYAMLAGAGGVDFSISRRINLRAEYQYQDWFNAPGSGLSIKPSMFSVGAAYHFDAGTPHRMKH